jgi:hypothetical protein
MKCLFSAVLVFLNVVIFFSCKKESSCEGCKENSKPPIAMAGRDTAIVLTGDSIMLDGNASYDPDGTIAEYKWSKIAGPGSFTINNSQAAKPFIKNLVTGSYELELKVTDNDGLSAKDTIRIIVDAVPTNHPPIANAGPDIAIVLPTNTVVLNGSGSTDVDNNITNYLWAKISGPSSFSFSNANAVQTQATSLIDGIYLFELKVTDAGGLFSKDTIRIIVDAVPTNHPPIANAGPDMTITLPTNTVMLNGSGSTDVDNNITNYLWTKISGPSSFSISNANTIQTQVTSLVEGVYEFELKITDAGGLFSKDTMQVTVNPVPVLNCGSNRPQLQVTQTVFGTLSKARSFMAVAAAGNKIVFAGGQTDSAYPSEMWGSSRVDIYDISTNTWSTAELSVPRFGIGAIAAGNKIFFAGGTSGLLGDPTETYYSTVDIYDVSTNTWSVSSLSEHVSDPAVAVLGNKVFFAGGYGTNTIGNTTYYGYYSNKIDIYDLSTNTWSSSFLSDHKDGISAVTINNKVYFAGGHNVGANGNNYSDKIDVYDGITHSWSVSTLSEPKAVVWGGIAVGNKIYWGGGSTMQGETCKVEIRDVNTQTTSFENLSYPDGVKALLNNGKILYRRYWQPQLDIYDTNTNSWYISNLPINRPYASFISVNNVVYMAGGIGNNANQVWKLDF